MSKAFLDRYVQIDVKRLTDKFAICGMYTGVLYVEVVMTLESYNELVRKKFFIRDGKSVDSAGVLNTTDVYKI